MIKLISNIVFTKNRPMQLDAYLTSLYRYFPVALIQTYILYKVELFAEEYEQVFRRFPDCIVIKETDFHEDCLRILERVNTRYILFGIDDVVYFDSVDLDVIEKAFNAPEADTFGFSLKFHPGIFQGTGDDIVTVRISQQQEMYRFNWKTGKSHSARYPFELCATIYKSELVKKVIAGTMNHNPLCRGLFRPGSVLIRTLSRIISTRSIMKSFGYFFNPNTLESWNCRRCQNHAEDLPALIYFQKICASAVQVNMVNTTTVNELESPREFAIENLTDKYRQGYRVDIDFVAKNKPVTTHCGPEFFKIVKG